MAAILALIAGAALLVFLREYKDDLTASDPVQVLVARSLVPKGTPGDAIASDQLYSLSRVKNSQLEDGAITDPDEMLGKVVASDIHPGHQLRSSDFESGRAAQARIAGFQRAMQVPVDPLRGMIGKIEAGDYVDVIGSLDSGVGAATAGIVARNVLVLSVPSEADDGGIGGTKDQPALIRIRDVDAPAIAAARDGGEVWLVLRPPYSAKSHTSNRSVRELIKAFRR